LFGGDGEERKKKRVLKAKVFFTKPFQPFASDFYANDFLTERMMTNSLSPPLVPGGRHKKHVMLETWDGRELWISSRCFWLYMEGYIALNMFELLIAM
jgi:hypothetical protein